MDIRQLAYSGPKREDVEWYTSAPHFRDPEEQLVRMKDAITVALVLGRELRDASEDEVAGITASIGAIRGHMVHVHSADFDPTAFDAAVERGRSGDLGW